MVKNVRATSSAGAPLCRMAYNWYNVLSCMNLDAGVLEHLLARNLSKTASTIPSVRLSR